jgi:hypothetical protein
VILPKKITIENVLVILFIKMTRSFDTQDHMLLVSRISFNTFKNIKNFHKKMLRVHFDILYARQVASQKPIHLVTCGKKGKFGAKKLHFTNEIKHIYWSSTKLVFGISRCTCEFFGVFLIFQNVFPVAAAYVPKIKGEFLV